MRFFVASCFLVSRGFGIEHGGHFVLFRVSHLVAVERVARIVGCHVDEFGFCVAAIVLGVGRTAPIGCVLALATTAAVRVHALMASPFGATVTEPNLASTY